MADLSIPRRAREAILQTLRGSPVFLLLLVTCNDPLHPPPTTGPAAASSSTGLGVDAPTEPASRPMMIDFTRDFCLPCQIMAPSLGELRQAHSGAIDIVEVNTDRPENERYARFFAIETVPTQVFVDGSGLIVERHGGIATKQEMTMTLQRLGWIP